MTEQAFQVGNIVHVEGFKSQTSTGEVRDITTNDTDGTTWVDVGFQDGERAAFMVEDIRLATPDELYCYLHGNSKETIDDILADQPCMPFSTVRDGYIEGQAVMTPECFGEVVMIYGDGQYVVEENGDWIIYNDYDLRLCNAAEIDHFAPLHGRDTLEISKMKARITY